MNRIFLVVLSWLEKFRLFASRLEDRFRTQKQRRAMWVAALRSGKYKQGKYFLRSCNGEFCCLGVLADLYYQETGRLAPKKAKGCYMYGSQSGTLASEVNEWVGLSSPLGAFNRHSETLSHLNDGLNKSFDEIADIIESEPEGLFVS